MTPVTGWNVAFVVSKKCLKFLILRKKKQVNMPDSDISFRKKKFIFFI